MALSSADVVEAIRVAYLQLDDNFDAIYAKCQTDDQRKQLRGLFASVRGVYFSALAKALSDANPLVQELTNELQATNQKIKGDLQGLQDIVEFLKLVTAAVKLAASLATLAAAA